MSEEDETVVVIGGIRSSLNALEAMVGDIKTNNTHNTIQAYLLSAKALVESSISTAQNE